MAEFPQGDQQRDTYVNGLLTELSDAEQHLAAAKDAGKDTKELDEHISSVKAELSRVGADVDSDSKEPAVHKRPAKPAVETR